MPPPANPILPYPTDGGRNLSLEFRPRRFFGFRLDRIVNDFLGNPELRSLGLRVTLLDLLRGAVRSDLDERVLVSAHHSPRRGAVLATVTLFYHLPSAETRELEELIELLGRRPGDHDYYRMGTPEGTLPVRGSLEIRTMPLGATPPLGATTARGETALVTTLTAMAELVEVRTPEDKRKAKNG